MKRRILKIVKWAGITLISIVILITACLYFFKDEICGAVIDEVNKHLKAKVSVSEVDLTFWSSFPNLSVDFNHVFIQDSYANASSDDTLLYSERIRLKFNPMDIWNEDYQVKSIHVSPGCVQLKVNAEGEVNYDIIKPTEDTVSKAFQFELKKVLLSNVRFSYKNDATDQLYKTSLNEMELSGNFTDKIYNLRAKSTLNVDKAKSGKITLLSNKPAAFDVNLRVNNESGVVSLSNALVYISDLPFTVNGNVTQKELSFNVKSKDIQLADLATNFAMDQVKEIKKFEGRGKVFFDLDINGELISTSPVDIDCDFGINGGELTEPESRIRMRNIHLAGKYSNKGGPDKEYLSLDGIRFTTLGGPFAGNLKLTHFNAPRFKGKANGNLDLQIVHSLFNLPLVENIRGSVLINSDFDVKAVPQADESLDYSILKCEGDMNLRSINLKLKEDKRTFKNVNGRLYLRNDEAGIDKVNVEVGSSDILIDGVLSNIVSYLKDKGKLNINAQLRSRVIDISDLGTTTKEEKIMDGRQFVLPNDLDGSVYMEVSKMNYEGHSFRQLKGNMLIGERIFHFPAIALQNAGADISGNLTIEERTPEIFHLITNVASNNIQFKPLFKEWNNFRQEVISENNVSGKAQARVYLEAPFDLRSGVVSKSIKSEIYIKIHDGRLKGVDAFKSITESLRTSSPAKLAIGKNNISLLEKKLLDLKFETLENTLIIRNGKMEIPKMNILSSALDIEVNGTHTFDNIIDYRFAFRFRELKDKNRTEEFGEEIDDGTGVRVYMKMYGPLDNPTIEWDKQAKKDQAKENREVAKQDAKSILKTEFGFFKNDTSVKIYQEIKRPREEIQMDFGTSDEKEPVEFDKPKKDGKLKNKLKTLKEQSEKDKSQELEFDFN